MQNTKLIKKISTSLVSTGEIIDSLQSNSSTSAPSIRAVNEALSDNFYEILNHAYPIGSIYISINDTNPATLFGGTWERFGKGKTLISVDEDDTDFEEAQKTGGEKEHTLSYAEMPMHNHMAYTASAGAHSHTGRTDANGTHNHDATTESGGAHTHTATTASAGSHSHTGTAASAGAHTHYFDYRDVYRIDARGRGGIGSGYGTGNFYRTSSAGAHTHSVTTVSAGAHTHTTTIASGGTHTHTTTIENDGLHSHNFTTDEVEAHTHSVTVNSSGQSNAHNNLQPYITVYMWLRTA